MERQETDLPFLFPIHPSFFVFLVFFVASFGVRAESEKSSWNSRERTQRTQRTEIGVKTMLASGVTRRGNCAGTRVRE